MLKTILPAMLIAFVPGVAHAQISAPTMLQPMLYLGPAKSYQDHVNAQNAARDRRAGTPDAPIAKPADPAATRYRPDPARRRDNLAQFVARTRKADPASADALAQLFAEQDFIERIKPLVGTVGLDVTSVADAYAFYWVVAWNASKGENPTPSRRTMDAVKRQAAELILAAPAFQTANEAARQNMAEALWVQGMVLDQAIDHAKKQPAILKGIVRAAHEGARAISLDLDTMTLSEDGFKPINS